MVGGGSYIKMMMTCKYLNDKDEADINEKSNSHSIVVLLLSLYQSDLLCKYDMKDVVLCVMYLWPG